MNLTILLPYPSAQTHAALWSRQEEQIDFRRDPHSAARCTLSFAAMELKRFLTRTVPDLTIQIADHPTDANPCIHLAVRDESSKSCAFEIVPSPGEVRIVGEGRTGVLYGAYELLRLQGWRWYAPGEMGEVAPPPRENILLPNRVIQGLASYSFGRGFDLLHPSQESTRLLLWMARNRMNLCGAGRWTAGLAEKLGMTTRTGGHIFEAILHPDFPTESGKTLWEEHPEWFGQPEDGARNKDHAQRTQFCVTQPALIEYLGEAMVAKLMNPWRSADWVDVWGFDTWGKFCHCESCLALGNGADQAAKLLSDLQTYLDEAFRAGRLDRIVRLGMCAYEGTNTLDAPQNPIPDNLSARGDYVVYYPINRCYEHDFDEATCPFNAAYAKPLVDWTKQERLSVVIGEYYNVSKWEDSPLLFTTRLRRDIPAYRRMGVTGLTYMHVPLLHWGVRALTNSLLAQLAWNVETNVDAFLDEYFHGYYGPHAATMRKAYQQIEQAGLQIASWRAWSARSVLSALQRWDGATPAEPLPVDAHFASPAEATRQGRQSIALLRDALKSVEESLAVCRAEAANQPSPAERQVAVNPAEAARLAMRNKIEQRLAEDRRGLLYGLDLFEILTATVQYHDSLFRNDAQAAEAAWRELERLADQLESYTVPLTLQDDEVGVESRDALTRSQVRDILARCRQARAART